MGKIDINETAKAVVGTGILASIWAYITGRKKRNAEAKREEFEEMKNIVSFWKDEGKDLLEKFQRLESDYKIVIEQNKILISQNDELLKQNNDLKRRVIELEKKLQMTG